VFLRDLYGLNTYIGNICTCEQFMLTFVVELDVKYMYVLVF